MRQRFTAPRADRIDRLIADSTRLSRNRARGLIEGGGVRVDGAVVSQPWAMVADGAAVEVRTVATTAVPTLPERYRDRWLLVVDKPSGLASQPTREGSRTHLTSMLSSKERYVGLHHRLDQPASGLVVVALDPAANAGLASAFQEHRVQRTYLAVVLGDPGAEGRWDTPVDGQAAITLWRRLSADGGMSVLELQLVTGRTHQIRQHAADAGYPLIGDRRYGGAAGRAWPRLALHAARLSLTHPVTSAPVDVSSPVPDDLTDLLTRAGRRAAGPEVASTARTSASNGPDRG